MPSALHESWLHGVAVNPAAPADVLLRLLSPEAGSAGKTMCSEGHLSPGLVETLLHHPQPRVRMALARNPRVAPDQRGRLADDPHALVRAHLAGGPWPRFGRPVPLPDDVLEKLLTFEDPEDGEPPLLTAGEIRAELSGSRQIPRSFQRRMHTHPHPAVRVYATHHWTLLTDRQRDALRTDPDAGIRESARRMDRYYFDPAATDEDLLTASPRSRRTILWGQALSDAAVEAGLLDDAIALAHNPNTPAPALATLARDPDPEVRLAVAGRADLTTELWDLLAADPDQDVRTRALVQPLPRTTPDCAALNRSFGPSYIWPHGELWNEPSADRYRAMATSPHPRARRAAALAAHLAPDLVALLAEDPDPTVRHLVAHHQDLAPAATVLEAFLDLPALREHLLRSPNLPRTGLAHLLDHEDPEVRALAATDPTLPAEVLETLLHDPDLARPAASNPALTPTRLHTLLDAAGLPHPVTP
ncbi:hypothetical protein ACIA8O_01065 [Kitasatospora sp. NPDC051853]|uniref:hypothetical protein n=1 Tax=Kitasatospora sp. NPDC051853 TaxID=3364058 RepID=UPI0037902DFC